MRILYITLDPISSSSSASERNRNIINGFLELGHHVDLITISEFNEKKCEKLRTYTLGKSYTYNSNAKTSKLKNIIKKIYYKFFILDNTRLITYKNIDFDFMDKYEFIISSSDPKTSHIFARKLINYYKITYSKWYQYWGDPLANDISNKTIYPRIILKILEKRIFSKSDSIFYVSPFTFENQKKLFSNEKRFRFLPIPFSEKPVETKNKGESLNFGYFGSYYSNIRDITPLYEAFKEFNKFQLIIAGNSDLALSQYNNISILPNQKLEQLRELESNTNVYICILNKRGTQIPGKIYHYAGTNVPILVLVAGDKKNEIVKYLEKFNRFIICENSKEEIINKLKIVDFNLKIKPNYKLNSKNIVELMINNKNFEF